MGIHSSLLPQLAPIKNELVVVNLDNDEVSEPLPLPNFDTNNHMEEDQNGDIIHDKALPEPESSILFEELRSIISPGLNSDIIHDNTFFINSFISKYDNNSKDKSNSNCIFTFFFICITKIQKPIDVCQNDNHDNYYTPSHGQW
jgi:hypothetical protein